MRFVTLALVALLALVHVELWFGKGGVPRMVELGMIKPDEILVQLSTPRR